MSQVFANTLFLPADILAVGFLVCAWLGIGLATDKPPRGRPSVSYLMSGYRRRWMREFVTRDPRIFDAQVISNMRQGTAFFASASMIAIGGGLALVGNAERLRGVATDLTLEADPLIVWELKLVLPLFFALNAFLKFVWSHRLFGYCAVLMAAVPNDLGDPDVYPMAEKAAEVNITAARGFNRGLRSVYFGIASTAWLVGAVPLVLASAFTLLIVWRREFASHSRSVLMRDTSRGNTEK